MRIEQFDFQDCLTIELRLPDEKKQKYPCCTTDFEGRNLKKTETL